MKLPNFYEENNELDIVRNHMNASLVNFENNNYWNEIKFNENKIIELEINGVLDLTASDFYTYIKTDINGNFIFNNRLQILYINNSDTKTDFKFHLVNCSAISNAQNNNREDRFITQNYPDGKFTFKFKGNQRYVDLQVCKHCLRKQKYKNYHFLNLYEQEEIVKNFNFREYEKIFRYVK